MSREKKMFRWFTMVDFEEEEIFLREQHQQGWKFKKFTKPGFYTFEECEPEDIVYRLDYSTVENNAKEDYVQMFSDCDWEYMFDVNGWSYFRKPADAEEQNNDIFSDMETKIALLSRVKQTMIPLLIIFFCVIIPQIIMNCVYVQRGVRSAVSMAFLVVFLLMFLLYLCLFLKFGWGLQKLKRKYLEGER